MAGANIVKIKSTVSALITPGTKSPLRLSSARALTNAKSLTPEIASNLASDLNSIETTVNALHTAAQAQPSINQILLTNPQGQVVAAIGNLIYDGVPWVNYMSELHVANPQDPTDPTGAIFNANRDGSVTIGGNGWLDVHDSFDGNAAWIGTQNETLVITNAVNNGSGAIRLTVTGHTLITGNSATVRNMNLVNVGNANGTWTVTAIDVNTIDLQGSIYSGPFQPQVNPPAGLPTYQPTIDRVLQIANVTDAGGLFQIQTSIPHGYESGTKVNIPATSGPKGSPAAVGQWIISIPDTLAVTGAVNNGSGLIRLTVPKGNYKTGDRVQALAIGGVPNADGNWIVTAISATVIDLQGSTFIGTYTSGGTATFTNANTFTLVDSAFSGSYVSGGTVLQYFGGILAETIAIGPSFQNYKLRAFPSGDLRINNADISLTSASGQIVLDPTMTQIRLTNFNNLSEIVLDATVPSLTFYDQTGTPDVTLEILQELPFPVSSATNASPVVLHVPGSGGTAGPPIVTSYVNGDTVLIKGASGNTIINGYRIVENFNALAETFTLTDLAGNVINGNGVFAGTTTCTRYYAGLLAQSLALGANWSGYRLRFFADGTLKLNRAAIDSSTITNTTITGSFTSVGGVAPNQVTLTISNGIVTASGAGTAAGTATITIDGLLTSGYLSLVGKAAAPTAPGAGLADIYYDTLLGGLYYNLAGAGWVPFGGAGPSGSFTPVLSFGGVSTGIVYAVNAGTYWTDGSGMVHATLQVALTNKGAATGVATIAGLPSNPAAQWEASVEAIGMLGLTGAMSANVQGGTGTIQLNQWGATGVAALTDTFFTNTSNIVVSLMYHP